MAASVLMRRGTAAALACFVASSVACGLLLWDIGVVPRAGFDEWWYLFRIERLLVSHDFRDTVGWDLFADFGQFPKVPPLLHPMRLAVHFGLGLGAVAARPISAVEFLILALLLGLVARKFGAPDWAAALCPAILLTFPTIFFFARTWRSEQDIFFLGTLSLLLPLLSHHRSLWMWGASGGLAGVAAMMHPMGVVFALAHVLASLPLLREGGAGVRSWRPAIAWLVASAVPVAGTLAYYGSDWENMRTFSAATRVFFAVHGSFRQAALVALAPVPGWLPDGLAAVVNASRWGLAPFGPALAAPMSAVWGVALVGTLLASIAFYARRLFGRKRPEAPVHSLCLLGSSAILSAAVVTLLFPPNTDYSLYLNGLLAFAACLALTLAAGSTSRLRFLARGGLVLLASGGLVWAARVVTSSDPARTPAVAAQIAAMRSTAAAVGIQSGSAERVYADTVSWAGAGAESSPLYEHLILEIVPRRPSYYGVTFSASWYRTFVPQIATFSGLPIDVERRRRLMDALVEGLSFAACLVTERADGGPDDLRLWLVRRPGDPRFAFLNADGRLRTYLGAHAGELPFQHPTGTFSLELPMHLPSGRYAVTVIGDEISDSDLSVSTGQGTVAGNRTESFPHRSVGSLAFVAAGDGTSLARVHARAVSAGTGRVVYWRLEPE